MRRINSHTTGVDQGSLILFSDFENGGDMWSGDGPRKLRTKVKFSEPFQSAPSVQVSLSMWDFDQKTSTRVDISAIEVSQTGFVILFQTWADTRIARVRADWMAIGALSDDDVWDVD